MSRFLFFLLFVVLIGSACGTTKQLPENSPKFKLEILQNGKVYTAADSPIMLARQAFKLRFTLYDIEGVMFSSAFDRYYYDTPAEADIFECDMETYTGPCKFVSPKSIAEPKFNAERLLIIGDEHRVNYWYYDPESPVHRFDDPVSTTGSTVIANRSVSQLFYPEEDRYIKLQDIDQDIYVVVAAQAEQTEEDAQLNKAGKEVQREKFIIRFE